MFEFKRTNEIFSRCFVSKFKIQTITFHKIQLQNLPEKNCFKILRRRRKTYYSRADDFQRVKMRHFQDVLLQSLKFKPLLFIKFNLKILIVKKPFHSLNLVLSSLGDASGRIRYHPILKLPMSCSSSQGEVYFFLQIIVHTYLLDSEISFCCI